MNAALDQSTNAKGQKPWPVIIMLVMLFSVIIAGLLLVPRTEEQKLWWLSILGTNNYGELINPPIELAGQILDSEGNPWSDDMETPWKLVLMSQGACAADCQQIAEFATRVHARMNKLAPELKRGYLSIGSGSGPDASLDYETLQAPNLDFPALLEETNVPPLSDGPLLFVMNPLEVIFLYYTTEHEGVGMLEDIEHVIELSH